MVQNTEFGKKDKYNFTITPESDSKKWKELDAHSKKIKVCQIPEQKLESISTESLIDTCLEYPMFGDMMLFDNVQDGFTSISQNFNGLDELLGREDCGECLYEVYSSIDFDTILETEEYPLLRLKYFETIMAQEKVLKSMGKETRNELLNLCKIYFEIKIVEYKDELDPLPTLWIISRILEMDNMEFDKLIKENESLKHFVEYGEMINVTSKDVEEVFAYIYDEK